MILYKYFQSSDHRQNWLEGHGKIFFSPIENYTKESCESARHDEFENSSLFPGQQSVKINGKNFVAENLRISDDCMENYISCFSTTLSDKLKLKFGSYVLKFESKDFLNFLSNHNFSDLSFKMGKVDYVDSLNISPSSPFRKLKKCCNGNLYQEEEEFRILMKIHKKDYSDKLGIKKLERFPLELEGLKQYFFIL